MVTQIHFTTQCKSIAAELYAPAGTGISETGLVVVTYGSDGLTDNLSGPWATMIRDYAESLANSGLVAMIPDYFAVTGTQPGPSIFDVIAEHRDKWQSAISDAIDHARTTSLVSTSRIGLLGFSLGGHLCLRLRDKADVLVEYFAPVLDGIGTPGNLTHAQIHHGTADSLPGTGFSNAEAIKTTLKREGTSTELFAYAGASHGFIGDDQANTDARKLSKDRTLEFFRSHL
ncbi:MAG: dienelactone hydrolase family protein [Candidatus Competibacteraceae bacterium]|nr:dienelactone hydrolase family protein [Candidatus Competibacteraceae bacterium]